jgi:hypothetical protein
VEAGNLVLLSTRQISAQSAAKGWQVLAKRRVVRFLKLADSSITRARCSYAHAHALKHLAQLAMQWRRQVMFFKKETLHRHEC